MSSVDDDDEGLLLPTPRQSFDHLRAHRTALIATFIIAVVWFAQIIAPLYTELSTARGVGAVRGVAVRGVLCAHTRA